MTMERIGGNETWEAFREGRIRIREQDARKAEWAKARGLRSSHGQCLHWIARGRCAAGWCRENHTDHAWMDHATGWTKDGKPALLLCQPYQLGEEDFRDLLLVAERFNLKFSVHGCGWYGFGTVAVELTRA
jgi:hypothetical protein